MWGQGLPLPVPLDAVHEVVNQGCVQSFVFLQILGPSGHFHGQNFPFIVSLNIECGHLSVLVLEGHAAAFARVAQLVGPIPAVEVGLAVQLYLVIEHRRAAAFHQHAIGDGAQFAGGDDADTLLFLVVFRRQPRFQILRGRLLVYTKYGHL